MAMFVPLNTMASLSGQMQAIEGNTTSLSILTWRL